MSRWRRWLPGIDTLRRYEAAWLPRDIFAGLVLATMLVPVGIAYAAASGLPGIHGLYATIVPLLAYAIFGPSRIIVLGPDSALAAVILGVVAPLSGGDPVRAATLAAMMALVSGTVLILAGIARLGFVTELLSKPIRYGYMNGIALTVLISQLPKLLGFSITSEGPLRDLWAIAGGINDGKANWVAFAVGLATLIVILLLKDNKRLPGILIAVVGATFVVAALDLGTRYGVKVLGSLPQGLPALSIPWIGYSDLIPVLAGGCAIALVSFADTSVLSRTYAARLGADTPNRRQHGAPVLGLESPNDNGAPIAHCFDDGIRGCLCHGQSPEIGRPSGAKHPMPELPYRIVIATPPTAAKAAFGRYCSRFGATISRKAIASAPTTLVSWVCAPAASATGVREELLLIEKP